MKRVKKEGGCAVVALALLGGTLGVLGAIADGIAELIA